VLDDVQTSLKRTLQKALVHFTVAKVCEEGLFVITPAGIKIQFDQLPNDKVQEVNKDFLNTTARKAEENAGNYLAMAKRLISDNPDFFTDYPNSLTVTVNIVRAPNVNNAVFGM